MDHREIASVSVIGSGNLGRQIAEVLVLAGTSVTLVKATGGDVDKVVARARATFEKLVKKNKLSSEEMDAALSRLKVTGDLASIKGSTVIIESIIEDANSKRELLARVVELADANAIITSNTSTLPLQSLCPSSALERFAGLHFFSPVRAMKLVELAPLPETSAATMATLRQLCSSIGKTVVEVGPTPGYIVNRLLTPQLLSAIRALASGLAPVAAIDEAMTLGLGHPMGPLALCDLIGLDIVFDMSRTLYRELGDPAYRAPALLRRMVQDGALGRKANRGFYIYEGREMTANPEIGSLVGESVPEAA